MRLLVVLAITLATASIAHADGMFFTESVGGARIHDELGAYTDGGARIRIGLGIRRGHWAVEGFFAGMIGPVSSQPVAYDGAPVDTLWSKPAGPDAMVAFGVDLKYIQPVADHLELYLRGSASKAALAGASFDGYEGRGLGAGAGIQLKGKVPALGFLWFPLFFTNWGPKVTAALYLDTGYDFYRFHKDTRAAIDAQVSTMMLGFSVGSDF